METAFILYCSGNNDKENIFMCPVQMEVFLLSIFGWLHSWVWNPQAWRVDCAMLFVFRQQFLLISGKGFSDVREALPRQ